VIWAVIALSALVLPAFADSVTCPASADSWVEMYRWENPEAGREAPLRNHGAETELVVKGREAFALLQFDLKAAAGMTVERAVLRIHRKDAALPFHTAGLSTISGNGPWTEQQVSYFHPASPGTTWSYAGSELVAVTFAQGGSLYTYERARDTGGGWWEIDVPPAIVHALATGDQFGLMLTDEKGQTQERHLFSSRESLNPPVLVIEGARSDKRPPGAVRKIAGPRMSLAAGDDGEEGIATRYDVRFSGKAITPQSFEAADPVPRWVIDPLAKKAHPLAVRNGLNDRASILVEDLEPGKTRYFAAVAVDEAGNRGPVTPLGSHRTEPTAVRSLPDVPAGKPAAATKASPSSFGVWAVPELLKIDPRTGALLEGTVEADHRTRDSVWDGGTVRLSGARNEFVAFQLAVESDQPVRGVEVRVSQPIFAGSKLPAVFEKSGAMQLYREWFVREDEDKRPQAWYPDALIPLAPFDIPAEDNRVPGQTVQPLFVDIFIPHTAKPGLHRGEITVQAAGVERTVKVEIDVLPFRLPDRPSFLVDLNCYSGVDSGYELKRGTPEYRALEHAYHRMAHIHRANLNVLGYSHTGTTVPDHAPPLAGNGGETRVADWSAWDAHFGPLLDGSAFAGLPRDSVPIAAMYLPFFENWPGDLRTSYKFNDFPIAKTEEEYRDIIARHALAASPVEEAFSREYQERFTAVVRDFAEHFRRRDFKRTQFQVYFNNKYYYKRPSQGGRGVSWWLLDEPNHRDDVRAVSFFANLAQLGLDGHRDVPIVIRTDISRVEWIRDLLAGQIDVNCVSRRFFEKNRYLLNDRHRFGRSFIHYASANHPRETNVAMRAWCWRVWVNGGDGVLPWNAVRGSEAWERAEQLTVFYPGSKFGRNEPYASLRLKAFRRGQQDVEYLALLAAKHGWDRAAVARAVAGALDLTGRTRLTHDEDAGNISFDKVRDDELDAVRRRVARALVEP